MTQFLLDNTTAIVLISFVVGYALLNVWKFKKPESDMGRAVMLVLMQISVFSLRAWGLKNPKIPFTSAIEELEREIELLEEKEKSDVERKLHAPPARD